jgi:hypothetical protein
MKNSIGNIGNRNRDLPACKRIASTEVTKISHYRNKEFGSKSKFAVSSDRPIRVETSLYLTRFVSHLPSSCLTFWHWSFTFNSNKSPT